jgi:3-hydroxybutyryl-CoA dehydrogenase
VKIALLGPGLMGAQVACEYALGRHEVVILARRVDAAEERLARSWATALEHGLATADEITEVQERILLTTDVAQTTGAEIIVESVVEDLDQKAEAVKPLLELSPAAIVASNTSSIPITAIGEAVGAPEQTVGAHYWNPPLLMPLVEIIRGEATSDATVATMEATVRSLGKRPVRVDRDVPGFVWNRLQLALLREAVWIVEQGVASPAVVDEIVRDGLARRWRYTGPFQTAALGGASTFERVAANLWPVLSQAGELDNLRQWLDETPETTLSLRERRDTGLAAELRADRAAERPGG